MNVLAIIPARGDSKRCPGKNWAKVGDETLMQRAVDSLPWSEGFQVTTCIVTDAIGSTIASLQDARWGKRVIILKEPDELAQDDVSMVDVGNWVLDQVWEGWGPTAIMLLQPTSPFRTASDAQVCLSLLKRTESDSVVSVVGVKDGKHVRYEHNGAIYVTRPEILRGGSWVGGVTQFYVMPPERSIDIDTPEDLAEARRLAGDG